MSIHARPVFALLMALWFCGGAAAQDKPRDAMPMAELQALAAVYDTLKSSMAEEVGGEKLVLSAIKGMVREVDPEGGEYYTEEEYKGLRRGPAGAAGIGVEFSRRGHHTMLLPLPAGPAASAGLRGGDMLLSIDGKPLRGMSLDDVVSAVRGPVGSKVKLRVLREFAVEPVDVEVERQVVARRDVSTSRPAADVVVLRVQAFGDRLLDDVVRHLDTEWRQAPYKGVVLDLRGSPGGLLDAAFGLAATFLPADVIIAQTHGRTAVANQVYRAKPADYLRSQPDPLKKLPPPLRALPMVVLVDGGTASGAEIVAAALKDHGRATIVGRTTFGRGSIQTLVPLRGNGAVKFTTAYWSSPSGTRIHTLGVQPDLVLPAGDAQQDLAAAIDALRKRLPS